MGVRFRLSNRMTTFEIEVTTGDVECAGTDANVFINIIGEKGETGTQKLSNSSSAHLNKFEKGNTDVFTLETKIEIGKMKAMEIHHDSWGLGSSWILEKVKVKNADENDEQEFLIRQWLDKNSEKDFTKVRKEVESSS